MKLKTVFEKPVDRPIEGVIKADDEAGLRVEVEEYVLTNEVAKRLESFLDAYNNYVGANGVWISGFFGSGKSHLLKILALLMENREIEGVKVSDMFLPKCEDNEILRGDLKKAMAIPSQSILFNIDQKADVIAKTQTDALLAVFVKVFDESCGYYGKLPYIAQFERELDQDGLFDNFKEAFKNISTYNWEWGRMRAKRVASSIDKAYKAATGQDVSGILDKYRSDYRLSIEDFAEQVNSYIELQGKNFRLNFFADEVGQYVADNVKLMTNLQTVAESLATKSRGRAWIAVTAQEDMETVTGEMGKRQSNDFSKIQARFANRLKLTSADVAEVIRKRLLLKNKDGIERLSEVYDAQKNNFKTLFDFTDGAQFYRNFQNREHFIHTYPFIPYQFILFQSAIRNLSMHNAFEGKHRSVGERSMLAVFQEVAVLISDHKIGQLATFDLMFEGLRSALKAQNQHSIQTAEQNLDDKFAVRVLKALFLVKYVKEFKATCRNLTVLMLDAFDKDMGRLDTELAQALNLLETQTYIQRNGEIYEFLTNEEKDIEEEIKITDVEADVVAEALYKIVFDGIIKHKKIRYDQNGSDYPFSKKLDDRLYGRQYELAIHLISPFHEHTGNEMILTMQSAGRDELLVIMPSDARMMRDLLMYEKTDKYCRQNFSTVKQESIKRIIADKNAQNIERYKDLKRHIQTLLSKSELYINRNLVDVGGEDAQARITKGFHDLIIRTYPNLKMLMGFAYTESYLSECLKQIGRPLSSETLMLSEAEQEMLAFIKTNKNSGVRTALKSLIERFERKSYGWNYAAILCILAKLCAAEKVELNFDSNILEKEQLKEALLNTRKHANLIIEPLIDFSAGQIRALKEFYEDFFHAPPSANDAKTLGKETASAFKKLNEKLSDLISEKDRYPFLSKLDAPIAKLSELQGKPYTYYLTELCKAEDELLDLKEGVIDPLQRFMNGTPKTIYDSVSKYIQAHEPNFTCLEDDQAWQIKETLSDPDCYKGNRMQQIKSGADALKEKINRKIVSETADAKAMIATLQTKLQSMDEFSSLKEVRKEELNRAFDAAMQQFEGQTLIAVIRDISHSFKKDVHPKLLSKMSAWTQVENISVHAIHVSYGKAWLADENDIERYLNSLGDAMRKAVSEGKRIQI
ncbi:BREX system P-loop protein BrxC [Desulfococcaceae bacterium HSG9]|nr:BREX system P-loop protein BrxC [Desulfococcaceae bacterium HSG9]